MSILSQRDRDVVFESLRAGLVPDRGIEAFAVGVERPRDELQRQLELIRGGSGAFKFLRGGYGCGKTFMARLALHDASAQGFATSFVVVSPNDMHFHRFDEVYRATLRALATPTCPRGALGDVLDRWIGRVEQGLIDAGADEAAEDFDAQVSARLNADLASMTRGEAPPDLVRAVQTYFELKQAGELVDASALVSWLSGSTNVSSHAKRRANIRGDIGGSEALNYLRGVVAIVRAAGYAGLVIVIDEAETILRMRRDTRERSLNGIRQITDAAGGLPGLMWLFTGTPELYETRQGVAGLPPLHDRIRFEKHGDYASPRQPQLELLPFDADRLREVAKRLRGLYPSRRPQQHQEQVSDAFIDLLVAKVSAGFGGDVGVVPRQFLRAFVSAMDCVDDQPDFDLQRDFTVSGAPLSPAEQRAARGAPSAEPPPEDSGPDDGLIPVMEAW